MVQSTFSLFKIGVGPSSSHTMGPMVAANRFANLALSQHLPVSRMKAELFGSLALTGRGHATDTATILGLAGFDPAAFCRDKADQTVASVARNGTLLLAGKWNIQFDCDNDLIFHMRQRLPRHPNGMTFTAFDAASHIICQQTYYSVGGGAIVEGDRFDAQADDGGLQCPHYPFRSAADLLCYAESERVPISSIMFANELTVRTDIQIKSDLASLRKAMMECIDRGSRTAGTLPGGLAVKRRAPELAVKLNNKWQSNEDDPLMVLDWINLWALSVNEENASGGQVVTAPTNGAAGIIPAILRYYEEFIPAASKDGSERFLLTAAAIGSLFKENASISGAEVGCQGEVGVACSMAAAGLTEVLGGTPAQVENAAEIAMEHCLGLTCDPVGGLVQIPCIERNAVGAVKAIEASRLALCGDGTHRISLDQVIETMLKTGLDMNSKYKETSQGGLAVNSVAC